MIKILEHKVDLDLSEGRGVHTLVAQIPVQLGLQGRLFKIRNRTQQNARIMSVLNIASRFTGDEKLHFILMPESCVPFDSLDQLLSRITEDLCDNTVVIFGVEHITLHQFRKVLDRHLADNADMVDLIADDQDGDDRSKPVNMCVTVIKENGGRLRCFFAAKTHPFAGEETVGDVFDLYRGKAFLLFSCENAPFNFMPLICFDYVYRDMYSSNIMTIIEKANEIHLRRHQNLDLLAVIQCNPKPEHKVFRDVVTGFYGEYLFKTPGTRDTLTVFINSSRETELEGASPQDSFGFSSIVTGIRHKLPRIKLSEFKTDDFGGSPVSRLRFGDTTRLYLCRLFPHHETDPRSSRAVLKVTGIYRPVGSDHWERMSGEDLLTGITDEMEEPDGYI
ncbi:MAG: hypothetical protein JSV70_04575 [bacterium]|nr:MAG: hypothetical protein JSV70_04575 [bacterium]